MTPQTNHIVEQIKARIERTRRTMYRQELLMAGLKTFSVVGLIGTLFVFIESLAEFDAQTRTILVYTHLTLSAIIGIWLMWRPLLRFLRILPPHSDREVARIIGAKFEKIADRLENMLDLTDMVKHGDFSGSPELIEVALEHFGKSTTGINFSGAISFTHLQSLARTVGAISTTVTVLAVVPGTPFHDAVNRMVHFDQEFRTPAAFYINVLPGTIEVVKGETVTVSATLEQGESVEALPKELTLSFSEEGVQASENIVLHADSTGIFRFLFPPMRQTVGYRFFSGDISSGRYAIQVSDRPFVRSMTVSLTPPSYTKLKRETLGENVGDVLVLPGTMVRWSITPNKPLASATLVLSDGTRHAMVSNGEAYGAELSPRSSSTYTVVLEDLRGNTNADPIQYSIGMLTDESPTVAILSPGRNVDVTEAMQLPMEIKVSDDFGITALQLKFRLVHSKYSSGEAEEAAIIPFDSINFRNEVLDYMWDLSLLGLVPEDVVEYAVEVKDNDAVNGPKSARSQSFLIRLPSLEEVFSDADKTHELSADKLEESLKEAQELRKDLKELSDDMKRNQQMDWQKQKKAEEVLKKYEEVQKKVDEVSRSIDDMTQNLQRNNTLSKETLEKYMELQKTLNELNSPEFRKAMQRMQEAMQNVSPEQMREAMEQAQFNEEQFRQNIERTMSLVKRIQIEQKVDELLKRTDLMKQEQQKVADETKKLSQNDTQKAAELARRQEEVQKQLTELQKELKELQKKMEEFPKEMPLDKLEDAQQSAQDREMQNAMKQSAQQLRSLQTERAMTAQQQASSGLNELQQQLGEMQEQMLNDQMQQTMNALRKAMQDLLQISQKQEQLKNRSRSLDPNSQQFRDVAQQQQALQGDLNTVAEGLAELSQKSFAVTPEMGKQIGRAMGQMDQSMGSIEQRNGSMASAQQGEAMASLNRAATQMQGAMQQMQQQGGQGGGSLMQQLRGMAMQQQQINMQTQQMGEREGSNGQQQMQEMGRLARQQEAVRKSLEQLQKESQGSPEKERVMGDLNKIADEMKEVVQQLQQNQADPNTVQKQERILSRLLQAQRSMRERDYEQKRKGTSATAPPARRPAELVATPGTSQRQKDIQRAEESGYSRDYLELIRRYYESLDAKEQ